MMPFLLRNDHSSLASTRPVDQYRAFLEEVPSQTLVLPNCDLDSGQPTKPAEYSLTDDAYAKLLAQLSDRKFDLTSPELRDDILQFYSDPSAAIETKKDSVRWQSLLASLDQLRSVAPLATAAGSPARMITCVSMADTTNHLS